LPGNASIKAEIAERLDRGDRFAVLVIDLDSFKAFNDRYGFDRGDEALRVLGNIVLEAVEGATSDFAGNIGGDDFVIVTSTDRAEPIAESVCGLVDERMPYLYDADDREAGFITSTDRKGTLQRFPLMTVSVAVVSNEGQQFRHHSEISEIGTEIKHYLKQREGSCYLKNRRGTVADATAPQGGYLAAPMLTHR
jgi:GGDEF domain-containing protein